MSAKAKLAQVKHPLVEIDLRARWASVPQPPRFILENYLPARVVTLLAGHGGTGKSNLALAMGAHIASGEPFAGLAVEQARVAFVSLEDPAELAHIRLSRIVEQYRLLEGAVLNNLTLIDGSDGDASLARDGDGGLIQTRVFSDLAAMVAGHGVVIIDNASDAYAGNENARADVRLFMRWLAGIARDNDAAVMLLAHIDKAAAKHGAQGNSYSGSTAWHNSARSRIALTHEDGALLLTHEKSNLGPVAPELRFTYTGGGVPVPLLDLAPMCEDFTDMLPAFHAASRASQSVYNNLTPGAYCAQVVLERFDELPQRYHGRSGRKLAAKGITRLLQDGKLIVDTYTRTGRKKAERLIAAPEVRLEAIK